MPDAAEHRPGAGAPAAPAELATVRALEVAGLTKVFRRRGGSDVVAVDDVSFSVAQGGSLYASDWALLFSVYADPGALDFLLNGCGTVANPQTTNKLMGYAPQTVTAAVTVAARCLTRYGAPTRSGASESHTIMASSSRRSGGRFAGRARTSRKSSTRR